MKLMDEIYEKLYKQCSQEVKSKRNAKMFSRIMTILVYANISVIKDEKKTELTNSRYEGIRPRGLGCLNLDP